MDQSAPSYQVIVLNWVLYKLLDQFAPTCQVVVWWVQFTLNITITCVCNSFVVIFCSLGRTMTQNRGRQLLIAGRTWELLEGTLRAATYTTWMTLTASRKIRYSLLKYLLTCSYIVLCELVVMITIAADLLDTLR